MRTLPLHAFSQAPQWNEEAFALAHQQAPPVSIRFHPHKGTGKALNSHPVPWCEGGYYLPVRPVFTLDPLLHAGAYYVQEASSMFVAQAFSQLLERSEKNIRVLDLCAAPGGKSTLLASLLSNEDLLIANEVIQARSAVLAENLTRWGQMNTWVSNNDPKDFAKTPQYFDVMLIDAPCTGSGLWRKDEKAMDEWSPAHVALCSERQKRIIADALPALKDEGLLIYATCSYSEEEDEQIADWICGQFDVESLSVSLDEKWGITQTRSKRHNAYCYRFYPWKVKGEGFFLAAFRIRKKEIAYAGSLSSSRIKQSGLAARWKPYLDTDFHLVEKGEHHVAIHPGHKDDQSFLSSVLKIKKTGTLLGKVLSKENIPEHELALSIHLSKEIPRVDLSKEQALRFLKKENTEVTQSLKGWVVTTYDGLALGWGKWFGNRMNNYYPKNMRIRMDID